ncbi:hypothetical protein U879_16380 [Defluviimonas sp. 20V17]|uniref:Outer membrane protein beta-barrel domain-containing protein n=1 Tax=Allgaiera indica TaxID=765699 RepID=A0AAN4ZZP7_9RHOB|nr:TorF family putative porin [Allgaiera indica]KDB02601.1 hypothetical protein U879_16380 [Defluviimonas sp. 20V17]GHE01687.1 hypothetical protein GCM10008024_18140 [Allgaiera indica]SDW96032.1 conserved hypothetical protein [Allgaiera indica]
MRIHLTMALLLAALSAPPALAGDLEIGGNLTFASRYLANGQPQSRGAVLQPSLEIAYQGFHAGVWASNTSSALIGYQSEVDLTFGYRRDLGAVSVDLGYARYLYRGPQKNCCGDVILDLVAEPSQGTELGLNIAFDPKSKVSNVSVSASRALTPRIATAGALGRVKGSHTYWSLGATYAVNDATTAELFWHDTNTGSGLAVLSLSYDFFLR